MQEGSEGPSPPLRDSLASEFGKARRQEANDDSRLAQVSPSGHACESAESEVPGRGRERKKDSLPSLDLLTTEMSVMVEDTIASMPCHAVLGMIERQLSIVKTQGGGWQSFQEGDHEVGESPVDLRVRSSFK